jgi:hypothetical protein
MTTPVLNSDQIENLGHAQCLGLTLPNNVKAATSSEMTYYEDFTHTTNWANALSTAATVKIVRRDNEVTMYIKGFLDTTMGASTLDFATAIPTRFRPTAKVSGLFSGEDAATNELIAALVGTDGSVKIGLYATAGVDMAPAAFSNTASGCSLPTMAFRWHLGL